jgi:Protein of unknown function (DUF3307)
MTADTSTIVAAAFVALFAGHQVGDHVVQTNADAAAKGAPTADRLASGVPPWAGWSACLRHVGSYSATQAAALALVCVAVPVALTGALSALVVSASTHAVIDRRWIVRRLIRAKRCQDWPEAPYLLDQSLHIGALLVAAVLAAVGTGPAGVAAVSAGAAAMLAAALAVERRSAAAYARTMSARG